MGIGKPNIFVVICKTNIPATLYQKNHDRNDKVWNTISIEMHLLLCRYCRSGAPHKWNFKLWKLKSSLLSLWFVLNWLSLSFRRVGQDIKQTKLSVVSFNLSSMDYVRSTNSPSLTLSQYYMRRNMSLACGMSVISLVFSIHLPAKLAFFKQVIGKSDIKQKQPEHTISDITKWMNPILCMHS